MAPAAAATGGVGATQAARSFVHSIPHALLTDSYKACHPLEYPDVTLMSAVRPFKCKGRWRSRHSSTASFAKASVYRKATTLQTRVWSHMAYVTLWRVT